MKEALRLRGWNGNVTYNVNVKGTLGQCAWVK